MSQRFTNLAEKIVGQVIGNCQLEADFQLKGEALAKLRKELVEKTEVELRSKWMLSNLGV